MAVNIILLRGDGGSTGSARNRTHIENARVKEREKRETKRRERAKARCAIPYELQLARGCFAWRYPRVIRGIGSRLKPP